jgi:hypothetical protein
MNGRAYSVRVEGAKYGANFDSALAIAISHTTNHSILWAINGILSWLYVIYFALERSFAASGNRALLARRNGGPLLGGGDSRPSPAVCR